MLIAKVKDYAFDKMHRDLESLDFSTRVMGLSLLNEYYAPQIYFNENKDDFLFDPNAFLKTYLVSLKQYTAELVANFSSTFSNKQLIVYSLLFNDHFQSAVGALTLAYIQEINLKIEEYLQAMHRILIVNSPTEPEVSH